MEFADNEAEASVCGMQRNAAVSCLRFLLVRSVARSLLVAPDIFMASHDCNAIIDVPLLFYVPTHSR